MNKVVCILENLGFLPTSGLVHGRTVQSCPAVSVRLEVGEGLKLIEGAADVEPGHLAGWGQVRVSSGRNPVYPGLDGVGHRARVAWVLEGVGALTVRWQGGRGGSGAVTIEVGHV